MITVISGAPCSGKSTYAKKHAKAGDLIIDFDAMAHAMGAETDHMATGVVASAARVARIAAIQYALTNMQTTPETAYIIDSSPTRDRLISYGRAGVEFVLLNPGKKECMNRARKAKRPKGTLSAIEAWYKRTNCNEWEVSQTSREW